MSIYKTQVITNDLENSRIFKIYTSSYGNEMFHKAMKEALEYGYIRENKLWRYGLLKTKPKCYINI